MKALLEALTPGEADWTLATALDPARLAEPIAIIMVGAGRWASRRSLLRVAGHKAGIGPVRSTARRGGKLSGRRIDEETISGNLYISGTLDPGLLKAILDFQKRDRRFGGLNKELPAEPHRMEALGVSSQ